MFTNNKILILGMLMAALMVNPLAHAKQTKSKSAPNKQSTNKRAKKSSAKAKLAQASPAFEQWLQTLKNDALAQGISNQTVDDTLKNAQLMPEVIRLDRAQPEFITPLSDYLATRITTKSIAQGRAMLNEHADLLIKAEQQYGVPANILVAFWGMESHFGANMGDFGLPSSLMTLAYDGRRADFFRAQLIDSMRIIEAQHMTVKAMRGSWAGAFGHMQFMPSTMLKYGVDADNNGKIELKTSMPDAFASAANYLHKVGWQRGQPAAIEIKLPQDFDYNLAQLRLRKTSAEWAALNITTINGDALPEAPSSAILLPQGWQGPAIMVYPNFDVILDWNHSVKYALAVTLLANNFLEDSTLQGGAEAEAGALSFNQMWAIQVKLNTLGYECGAPDGFPGLKTQAAIRKYQTAEQLPADGYASPSLYKRMVLGQE